MRCSARFESAPRRIFSGLIFSPATILPRRRRSVRVGRGVGFVCFSPSCSAMPAPTASSSQARVAAALAAGMEVIVVPPPSPARNFETLTYWTAPRWETTLARCRPSCGDESRRTGASSNVRRPLSRRDKHKRGVGNRDAVIRRSESRHAPATPRR
jgi:hypothetical protein